MGKVSTTIYSGYLQFIERFPVCRPLTTSCLILSSLVLRFSVEEQSQRVIGPDGNGIN